MPADRLLLIDASSFVYRAFHGLPDLRSKAGLPTGAVTGMVNMLRRVREEFPARYAACVFDPPGKTFRDDIFPDYKANRSAMPDDLRTQMPYILEVVRALGWPLVVVEGLEADDVIGTLATQATEMGLDTLIATGDKDLAQLVSDQVTLVDTMTRDGGPPKRMDRAGVLEKFGVAPERIVDYLSLVGCSGGGEGRTQDGRQVDCRVRILGGCHGLGPRDQGRGGGKPSQGSRLAANRQSACDGEV
jgi:DNA polymerase-1